MPHRSDIQQQMPPRLGKALRPVPAVPVSHNGNGAPHVHRVSLRDKQVIEGFFETEERNSLLICGDSQKALTGIPDGVFQTCVTSPPYWSLRNYNIDGQIGLEQSVTEYIDHLVGVFTEVLRALRDDGTLWVNIGDSYTSGGRTWRATDKKNPVRAMDVRPPTPNGLKPKDLIGVPWLLAFTLQKQERRNHSWLNRQFIPQAHRGKWLFISCSLQRARAGSFRFHILNSRPNVASAQQGTAAAFPSRL
jgi:hypothetical protein